MSMSMSMSMSTSFLYLMGRVFRLFIFLFLMYAASPSHSFKLTPDIINGTSGNVSSSSKYATGFQVKKWDTFKLGYFLSSSFPEEARFALELAFAQWRVNSNFVFYDSQGFYDYALTLGFYRRNHGDGSKYAFDGRGGVLAHAYLPPVGVLHFDADEKWCFDNVNGVPPDTVDFETVALHEIGHLLGMKHSDIPSAVMYGELGYGEFKSLTQDDIDGLAYIYGKKIN